MREKVIEQKLVAEVKKRGGICPKWVSPGFDGMPDRIVLLPGRHFGLVEVKAPGERPRPLQVSRHRLLMRLGFRVYVLDDPEQIGGILDEIQSHPIAAILLDMGMGKTSIVLAALNDLMFDSFEVTKVLIIAPLRVAKHTWSAEIQKWDQLRGLRYSIAVGTAAERMKALQADADIYIINRENVPWLIEKSGLPFDYDMVVDR